MVFGVLDESNSPANSNECVHIIFAHKYALETHYIYIWCTERIVGQWWSSSIVKAAKSTDSHSNFHHCCLAIRHSGEAKKTTSRTQLVPDNSGGTLWYHAYKRGASDTRAMRDLHHRGVRPAAIIDNWPATNSYTIVRSHPECMYHGV